MNVLFFLGAGISYASGLPSMAKITSRILNDQWSLQPSQVFRPGSPPVVQNAPESLKHCSQTPSIQEFLKILKNFGDQSRNIDEWGEIQYEELFDLISILRWDLHGPPNPSSGELRNTMIPSAEALWKNMKSHETSDTIDPFFEQSQDFIIDAVRFLLATPGEIKGLQLLQEAAGDPGIDRLDIATLNHDCLVEEYLKNAGRTITDGFGPVDGDLRAFAPDVYSSERDRIRIFKIHGSLDWYMFDRPSGQEGWIRGLAIPVNHDLWHSKDKTGTDWMADPPRSRILIGQWSKWLDYHQYTYHAIFHEFVKALAGTDLLITSGYGWGDWAINQHLYDWLRSRTGNRMILLNETPEKDLLSPVHPKLPRGVSESGRMILIRKWFQDASWTGIKLNCHLFT